MLEPFLIQSREVEKRMEDNNLNWNQNVDCKSEVVG